MVPDRANYPIYKDTKAKTFSMLISNFTSVITSFQINAALAEIFANTIFFVIFATDAYLLMLTDILSWKLYRIFVILPIKWLC